MSPALVQSPAIVLYVFYDDGWLRLSVTRNGGGYPYEATLIERSYPDIKSFTFNYSHLMPYLKKRLCPAIRLDSQHRGR